MIELVVLPPAAKNYELAYTVEYIQEESEEPKAVVVIMAGTRENFYNELKRYWNK